MMLMLELGFRFFCCGLFAIGGGLATLPFLYNISKETAIMLEISLKVYHPVSLEIL